MTPAQYASYVRRNFPAVDAGVRGIPPLVAFVTPVAARLEALHPEFASVDSLPFLGLPMTTVPWLLVALGVALTGLGVLVWRTRTRLAVFGAVALGGVMIAVPLALSYPQKASDAQKVAAVGRVALSAKAAAGAQTANRLVDGMVTQAGTEMIPAVAHPLNLSPQAFEASLASNYPAVAKGLSAWASIKPGAVALVHLQVASVADAATMNGLDFTPLPWIIIGPGIALLLVGVAVLEGTRHVAARHPVSASSTASTSSASL